MRTRLLTIIALLAAVLVTAFLSACGGSDGGSASSDKVQFDLKKASEATAAKGSAEISLVASAKGDKQSGSLKITGKADFKNKKLDATMDLASILTAANVPTSGDTTVRLLLDDKKIWAKLPGVQGLALPGGQDWVSLDLQAAIDKFDLQAEADKAQAQPVDPIEMTKVGTEQLNGTEVTHLKAESTLRDFLNGLPADEKQRKQAIEQIEKQDDGKKALDEKIPAEIWVDSGNAIHRMTAKINDGDTEASIALDFKNFGTAVTIDPPASGDVFDATDLLLEAAGQFGSSLGGTGKTS